MNKLRPSVLVIVLFSLFIVLGGCSQREKITALQQLSGKEFAVPTGTVADKLVLSKLPDARFQYYNTVMDGALAVKTGKADALAYDEPILKNIAAKVDGLVILKEMITVDQYGFAVRKDDAPLKQAIDRTLGQLKTGGTGTEMLRRWFPVSGSPAPMPEIASSGDNGILRLGTSSVTEPFSFVDGSGMVVGYDIELARRVAAGLSQKLEVVNMDFGALIPALMSGKVDMIAACITITEERSEKVLFSEPYYTGGIAAMVAQ
ncbi:transporter substrate-binding domain-containing protein [Pelodictyon luteolum]|uniref:Amino acid ABC transporter substrate-binding protein, PAAT family n=1 Tax=Chlorobium luteolum (strain DSM 273 / BCRC 81028 / 2530) TaxID=319225 RepID=Q3B4K8_CHLL3|nr:transporter substrate-binding domain-containing protein [Pelodictyon luteolum]ABB23723.1 amino acid ABC transporter substrate-binding protein, PAAT family [Pelodictyon luteolum DSM 273]